MTAVVNKLVLRDGWAFIPQNGLWVLHVSGITKIWRYHFWRGKINQQNNQKYWKYENWKHTSNMSGRPYIPSKSIRGVGILCHWIVLSATSWILGLKHLKSFHQLTTQFDTHHKMYTHLPWDTSISTTFLRKMLHLTPVNTIKYCVNHP